MSTSLDSENDTQHEHAIVEILDYLTKSFDNRFFTPGGFLDFAKALIPYTIPFY